MCSPFVSYLMQCPQALVIKCSVQTVCLTVPIYVNYICVLEALGIFLIHFCTTDNLEVMAAFLRCNS